MREAAVDCARCVYLQFFLQNEVRQLQSEMCRMEAAAAESAKKQAEDAHSMLNHASSQDINTVQAKLTAEKSLRIAAEEELDKYASIVNIFHIFTCMCWYTCTCNARDCDLLWIR